MIHGTSCSGTALHTSCTMPKNHRPHKRDGSNLPHTPPESNLTIQNRARRTFPSLPPTILSTPAAEEILEQCEQWLNNRQRTALNESNAPQPPNNGFSPLFNKRKNYCANKPAGYNFLIRLSPNITILHLLSARFCTIAHNAALWQAQRQKPSLTKSN